MVLFRGSSALAGVVLIPSLIMAEVVSCDLSGVPVRFAIDYSQFAPPMNHNEPAQRRVTTVAMGDTEFPAEPIMMGDIRGFWAEGMGGSDVMMVMRGDGSPFMRMRGRANA